MNLNARAAGALCLVGGIVLTAIVWHSVLTRGRYDVKAAAVGPILIVVAVGFLIHGDAMPPTRATMRLRIYGVLGSVCALVQLHYFGFFEKGLVEIGVGALLIGVWLLPAQVFEQRGKPAEPHTAEPGQPHAVKPGSTPSAAPGTPRPIVPS